MNKKKIANICWIIALILIVAILGVLVYGYYKKQTLKISNPIVTMEVENFGTIKMELYPELAPESVKNFITLANNGFYDGLTFYRVVKDFMIQAGSPNGDGTSSATFKDLYNNDDENATYKFESGEDAKATDEYTIYGEFMANKYTNNTLNLTEGTLAMARGDYQAYSPTLTSESYNSGGSQFFIMTTNNHTNLTGYYAGFGKVIEGMDIVHAIENVECEASNTGNDEEAAEESANTEISKPKEQVVISSVKVETEGIDYGMPKTLKPFNYMQWLYSLYGMSGYAQ